MTARLLTFVVLVPLLALATRAGAQQLPPETLSPTTYVSPSGQYTLRIEPSDEYGGGPATYRLYDGLKLRWSRRLPFTLWHAAVGNDGSIGGYAYTKTPHEYEVGALRILLLNRNGRVRIDESIQRDPGRYVHSGPSPEGFVVFVDSENDRFVVLLSGLSPDYEETWRVYRISSAKRVAVLQPRLLMPEPDQVRVILDALPVPGTSLALVHWHRVRDRKRLSRFTLIDAKGAPVWTLDPPDEAAATDPAGAREPSAPRVPCPDALLPVHGRKEFGLQWSAARKRVYYTVARRPDGTWDVRERRREDIPR